MTISLITRQQVPTQQRVQHSAKLFGLHFPMKLEPFVFNMAGHLSDDYNGGYWEFYALSNGGFYMSPNSASPFKVSCDNGYEGKLSGDALGIAACLYAYSHLSFGEDAFADTCAQHFHWLREYMLDHPEAGAILGAID